MTLAPVCHVVCPSALSKLPALAAEMLQIPGAAADVNTSCVLHYLHCVSSNFLHKLEVAHMFIVNL